MSSGRSQQTVLPSSATTGASGSPPSDQAVEDLLAALTLRVQQATATAATAATAPVAPGASREITEDVAKVTFAYNVLGSFLGRDEFARVIPIAEVARNKREISFKQLYSATAAQVTLRGDITPIIEYVENLVAGKPATVAMSSDDQQIDSILLLESRHGAAVALGYVVS